jgi:hypothetical protein
MGSDDSAKISEWLRNQPFASFPGPAQVSALLHHPPPLFYFVFLSHVDQAGLKLLPGCWEYSTCHHAWDAVTFGPLFFFFL